MNLGQKFTLPELFMAGLLPAILMIVMLALWSVWSARNIKLDKTPFSLSEAISAVKDAAWELPLPLFIGFGIFGGYLAISEVAAATALYILLVEVFIYKEINLQGLFKVVMDSMKMVGGILLILGVSLAFTNYLVDAEIPMKLFEWIKSSVDSKLTFLILLNIFLLILGAILDIFSALVIIVPLIVPIALSYGIHPIHLGVIFLANMQIGYFTPPVGMNLFIASYRFNKPIIELYQATIPFMLILLLAVLIITYVPWLSLWFMG
jgi:tripartite ATP-independent transporter DctM subunit